MRNILAALFVCAAFVSPSMASSPSECAASARTLERLNSLVAGLADHFANDDLAAASEASDSKYHDLFIDLAEARQQAAIALVRVHAAQAEIQAKYEACS